MVDLKDAIENAIRQRELAKGQTLIQKLLRSRPKDPLNRLAVAKYFQRIGDFQSALRTVNTAKPQAWSKLNETEQKTRIFTMRVLNNLGASENAVRFVARLPDSAKKNHREDLEPIYFNNYLNDEALPILLRNAGKSDSELSYLERIQLAFAAEVYEETGQLDEATRLIQRVDAISNEPMAVAIINRIAGQIALARKDFALAHLKYEKARETLAALQFSPGNTKGTSVEHGFFLVSYAQFQAYLGNFAEAKKRLAEAQVILGIGNHKPEGWMNLFYFRGLIDFLETKNFPDDWKFILSYPSMRNPFRKMMSMHTTVPDSFSSPAVSAIARIEYDLFYQTKTTYAENEVSPQLGLDLIDRAAIVLFHAKDCGVAQFRFYETLWPDEHFTVSQCNQRIGQLVTRLRKLGFEVTWKDLNLKWVSGPAMVCHWNATIGPKGGDFLEKHPRFTREDLQRYFSVSKSSALNQIAEWSAAGHIKKETSSTKAKYLSLWSRPNPVQLSQHLPKADSGLTL